jgi:hypothetical protein
LSGNGDHWFAWVTDVAPENGGGVSLVGALISTSLGALHQPLITRDAYRADAFRVHALAHRKATGQAVRLIRLSFADTLEHLP